MPTMIALQRDRDRRTGKWATVFQQQLKRWFDIDSEALKDFRVRFFIQPCQVQVLERTFPEISFKEVK